MFGIRLRDWGNPRYLAQNEMIQYIRHCTFELSICLLNMTMSDSEESCGKSLGEELQWS